jgi:hypothetical protein
MKRKKLLIIVLLVLNMLNLIVLNLCTSEIIKNSFLITLTSVVALVFGVLLIIAGVLLLKTKNKDN